MKAHDRVMAGTFDYGAPVAFVSAATFDADPDAFTITDSKNARDSQASDE